MESHRLPTHAGSLLPDGSMIVSPSGVSRCLSHLSTGFMLIGRVGDWDHSTKHRQSCDVRRPDPVQERLQDASLVLRLPERFSCANQQQKGLSAGGSLEHSGQSCLGVQQQLLLERDIMPILLMWETNFRDNDIGKVSFTDFCMMTIQTSTQQLQGLSTTAANGFQLTLRPNETKTNSQVPEVRAFHSDSHRR